MEFKGIDVSKWQGNIDFQKVKKSGMNFVMLREGYGRKAPNQIDKMFKINYEKAKNVGINVGCYHYSYADSVEDAKKEAEFCLENIQGMQFEYPICFDIEDKTVFVLSNKIKTDIVKTFCDIIEKAGYYAMFYCNLTWLNNYLNKDELIKKYDLWLAQWNVDKPSETCGIWQKSDSGKIDGINGRVDLDIAYKDYPTIIKAKGLNGFSKSTSKPNQQHYYNYTVKKGDTLWNIANDLLGNGFRYKEIKSLNSLEKDTIYVGQTLKIPK